MYTPQNFLKTILLLVAEVCSTQLINGQTLYPAPKGELLNKTYTVNVNRKPLAIYDARIGSGDDNKRFKAVDDLLHSDQYYDTAAFGYFDLAGKASVSISVKSPIRSVKVLPSSNKIKAVIKGNKVTFSVDKPQNLTVEINGEYVKSLHLFINPKNAEPVNKRDTNLIYFGPGIHRISNLIIGDNKTLYVAGGAILRAVIGKNETFGVEPSGLKNYLPRIFVNGKHVRICGRGIIDASLSPIHAGNMIMLRGQDIQLEGVILRNSCGWTVPVRESDNVTIDNIKILGYRANSDGIDICNSRNVTVKNCFIRTNDDLIVVKTFKGEGLAGNIVVKKCVLWNQLAHPLSVGAEVREPINNVLFTDCDIIHDKGREWSLRIFQSDASLVSHITFDNIRIEESHNLISCWIGKNANSADKLLGSIRDITFKNICASGYPLAIELSATDGEPKIADINFLNVWLNGKPLKTEQIRRAGASKNVIIKSTFYSQ